MEIKIRLIEVTKLSYRAKLKTTTIPPISILILMGMEAIDKIIYDKVYWCIVA